MFGRQQRPDQRPLFIRYSDPLAQRRLQKTALNQPPSLRSSFAHDAYIFARETGGLIAGLPVFQFQEQGARYLGFDVQGAVDVAQINGWTVQLDGLIDYTRATLSDGAPVPRIPPLRVLFGVQAGPPDINGRAEIEYVFDQRRISAFETPTDGFAMVNLSLSWRPLGPESKLQLRASANNLLDAAGRRHASLLKDFAPLAGRDIRLGARFAF